ncbi:MAG TPA: hypothetical protein VMF06_22355, partial [Candidatus Limnocylindria bacterium]|nr:hypothetical protein [Candidatus Limnocylindria bacterium]
MLEKTQKLIHLPEMADFVKKGGFLASEFAIHRVRCREMHAEFFLLANEINKFGSNLIHRLMSDDKSTYKGDHESLCKALILRGLELFQ